MNRQPTPEEAEAGGNGRGKGRLLRRGPWENASTLTWSFPVILAGTVGFLVTSHFPE